MHERNGSKLESCSPLGPDATFNLVVARDSMWLKWLVRIPPSRLRAVIDYQFTQVGSIPKSSRHVIALKNELRIFSKDSSMSFTTYTKRVVPSYLTANLGSQANRLCNQLVRTPTNDANVNYAGLDARLDQLRRIGQLQIRLPADRTWKRNADGAYGCAVSVVIA